MWQNPGETKHKTPVVHSQRSCMGTHLILQGMIRENTREELPTRKAHQSYEAQGFY